MFQSVDKKSKPCCVPECHDKISSRHRFPLRDIDTFKTWIQGIDHPRFSTLTNEEIYKTYYVCTRHFAIISIYNCLQFLILMKPL